MNELNEEKHELFGDESPNFYQAKGLRQYAYMAVLWPRSLSKSMKIFFTVPDLS